jgi:hypothetical protein
MKIEAIFRLLYLPRVLCVEPAIWQGRSPQWGLPGQYKNLGCVLILGLARRIQNRDIWVFIPKYLLYFLFEDPTVYGIGSPGCVLHSQILR